MPASVRLAERCVPPLDGALEQIGSLLRLAHVQQDEGVRGRFGEGALRCHDV